MKRIVIPATLVAHTLGSFRWRDYARLVADNLAPVCISTDLYIYRFVYLPTRARVRSSAHLRMRLYAMNVAPRECAEHPR